MKVSTHDGRFHADEIFALAALNLLYPDLEIVRSRDENVYKNADIIVDVGHVYDPDNFIFDHHQSSFSLKRESEIPYASFGLVWKHFGEKLCGSSETSEHIDLVIVQAIDADDNGIDIYETKIDGIGFHTLSDKRTVKISRAATRDENGKFMIGRTKNRHGRRTIDLLPVMYDALVAQKKIYDRFKGEYFFCTPTGNRIDSDHLRRRVWMPTMKKAELKYREMKQTRHSFATHALSCGENPLWIAKVMGHRDTDMIIRVYGKYIENAGQQKDGAKFDGIYKGTMSKEK
jgi:hypothetical protein